MKSERLALEKKDVRVVVMEVMPTWANEWKVLESERKSELDAAVD